METLAAERYELETELGQGGMSVVYRARDRQLNRDVAVKILHRYLAKQPEARRRFHREAMAVARLRHRAIVDIYDYSGPEADDAYIVCELIRGPTLRELVEAFGPPGPEVAMMVGVELCGALAHAHGCGIVHRDLKPENVMITPEGQLKLMDFGIAQVLEGNTRLTATGTLVGSPAHMAPEVIDGQPADHRADLFSLGTLLYWLAVGELPFTAPHPSALFKRILDGDFVPADVACPKVGRRASRVIGRCLANRPEERPASAGQLASWLEAELKQVDLDPAGGQLRAYLMEPETVGPGIEARLVEVLIEHARSAVESREWSAASDAVNRILAREPRHAEARAILERLARGERRVALLRRSAAAAVPLVVTAGLVAFGMGRDDRRPPMADAATATLSSAPPAEAAPPRDLSAAPGDSTKEPEPALSRAARPEPNRRPPARERAPPPSPTSAARVSTSVAKGPDGPGPDEALPTARLTVQIGRGYADIWVDGELVLDLAFRGEVELPPGRHSVEVIRDRDKILSRLGLDEAPDDRPFPQFGRFAPRTVEVDDSGRLFEIGPRGPRELKDGILRFSIPTTPTEAARIDSWISS